MMAVVLLIAGLLAFWIWLRGHYIGAAVAFLAALWMGPGDTLPTDLGYSAAFALAPMTILWFYRDLRKGGAGRLARLSAWWQENLNQPTPPKAQKPKVYQSPEARKLEARARRRVAGLIIIVAIGATLTAIATRAAFAGHRTWLGVLICGAAPWAATAAVVTLSAIWGTFKEAMKPVPRQPRSRPEKPVLRPRVEPAFTAGSEQGLADTRAALDRAFADMSLWPADMHPVVDALLAERAARLQRGAMLLGIEYHPPGRYDA